MHHNHSANVSEHDFFSVMKSGFNQINRWFIRGLWLVLRHPQGNTKDVGSPPHQKLTDYLRWCWRKYQWVSETPPNSGLSISGCRLNEAPTDWDKRLKKKKILLLWNVEGLPLALQGFNMLSSLVSVFFQTIDDFPLQVEDQGEN